MDNRFLLIRFLYDEEVDDTMLRRRLAEDDSLRGEYERLRETKRALDGRSSLSPEPAVVDRVVASARDATVADGSARPRDRAPDRSPQSRSHASTRRVRRAGALLAVVLLAGIGWWAVPETGTAPADVNATGDAAPLQTASEGGSEAGLGQSMPEWDNRDELVQIHRRLEVLQTESRMDGWQQSQPVNRP